MIGAASVLLLIASAVAPAVTEQGSSCTQPLATATAAERGYGNVGVREFDNRVFIYVPEIRSAGGTFDAFQLWIVEGVYGRPFVQASGPLDQSAFERLRKSANVRATPLSVRRSGESLRATIARQTYTLDVTVRVASSGADSVSARVCRAR